MIIQWEEHADEPSKVKVKDFLSQKNFKTMDVSTQVGQYLVGIGNAKFDIREIGHLDAVKDIHIVSDGYKLVSKKWKVDPLVIDLGNGVKITLLL